MSIFTRRNHFPISHRTFVITGGSQGTGLSLALLLSSRGGNVCIIARTQSKLNSALEEIKAAAKDPAAQKFRAISCDLTDPTAVERGFEEVREWCKGVNEEGQGAPDVVWQCAGGTKPGYFKNQSGERVVQEAMGNYVSTALTANAALKLMTSAPPTRPNQPQRHIIFTSSILGFHPLPGYNTYSPSKAAIRSLADGLRSECLLYNISVSCCFPATIYSPGFEEEQKTKPELTKIIEGSDEGQTCEEVAGRCVEGLERGEVSVVTGWMGRVFRGAVWGGTPKGGNWGTMVVEMVVASVMGVVWRLIAWWLDGDVLRYRKKLVKEGKNVMDAK
ncbi:NAD(P)-binding protein [Ascodesmis nigricans]|uniref:3-dehydrosphinganine reductase n=1 Tax=Ascodesmis nigricans TaxID=341454 RepID=A0A4S2N3X2_9PEZI|nr:NAD(P)-binding protein [Ascodesmis nigricans]